MLQTVTWDPMGLEPLYCIQRELASYLEPNSVSAASIFRRKLVSEGCRHSLEKMPLKYWGARTPDRVSCHVVDLHV